jgi:hypothetical protein
MGIIFEIERLKQEAQALRDILQQYKDQEPEAKSCLRLLDPLIQQVLDGEITGPIPDDNIPCSYSFTEGTLRPILGMLSAYAEFSEHINGQDTDESRAWFAKVDKEIEEERKLENP